MAADRADQEVLLDFLRLMKQCKVIVHPPLALVGHDPLLLAHLRVTCKSWCQKLLQQLLPVAHSSDCTFFVHQESEGQNTVGELDALETDIQTVTQRLARVTNSGVPLLPAGLRRAMLAPEAPAQQQQQQQGAEAGGSGGSGSRKRPRTEHAAPDAAVNGDAPGSAPKSHTGAHCGQISLHAD